MKLKLFCASLLLCSFSAFAHPLDTDPASTIDPGSTLTLIQELNIPNTISTNFLGGKKFHGISDEFLNESRETGKADCGLRGLTNSMGEPANQDVVILPGSMLSVLSNVSTEVVSPGNQYSPEWRFIRYTFTLVTPNLNSLKIECSPSFWGGRYDVTVGEVKEALVGFFTLGFAPPAEF